MTSQAFVRPPRMAAWLVDLFAPSEQVESITGDLLEEFSDLESKLGAASARRWYWRQSTKTISRFIVAGFRVAPWSIAGAVVGGFLLRLLGSAWPERAMEAVFDRYPVYAHHHWHLYLFCMTNTMLIGSLLESVLIGCLVAVATKGREMVATMMLTVLLAALGGVSWVTDGMLVGSLLESMLIGCLVALAAKGREMVATMTLSVLLAIQDGVRLVQVARHWPEYFSVPHRTMDSVVTLLVFIFFGNSIMIVTGGSLVRKSRSAAASRPSPA
jgi:hypothetical protein